MGNAKTKAKENTEKNKKVQLINARIYKTDEYKEISDFIKRDDTPGDVGICLSGGGSVAMMAAMGQLRALDKMGYLSKTKAISTVSGGSWATVPFTYLPDHISDKDFLGEFVEDPAKLNLGRTNSPYSLDYLPKGNMGKAVASKSMRWTRLFLKALALLRLSLIGSFKTHKIWTYLIARNVLKPFGLASYNFFGNQKPSWFAFDKEQEKTIKENNPNLPGRCYTYQLGENRIKRPFHLCNGAMFVNPASNKDDTVDFLAPLQSNAFATGILSKEIGYFDKGKKIGGGMVSSHAFNSKILEAKGQNVKVRQSNPFSLSDITATSSAFFAARFNGKLQFIAPQFMYWPVSNPIESESKAHNFADAGVLDDTGVLNLLAFSDIKKVVYFSNALQTVYRDSKNPDTKNNIVLDKWIPPLFGYAPYKLWEDNSQRCGYVLYKDIPCEELKYHSPYLSKNQVFEPSQFIELCHGLYNACHNYNKPAAFFQKKLKVLGNKWYNISHDHGRYVDVLWVHYNPVADWQKCLSAEVSHKLEKYVNSNYKMKKTTHKINPQLSPETPVDDKFPNFILTQTHMPKYIINLFAHLTAWITYQQKNSLDKIFNDKE